MRVFTGVLLLLAAGSGVFAEDEIDHVTITPPAAGRAPLSSVEEPPLDDAILNAFSIRFMEENQRREASGQPPIASIGEYIRDYQRGERVRTVIDGQPRRPDPVSEQGELRRAFQAGAAPPNPSPFIDRGIESEWREPNRPGQANPAPPGPATSPEHGSEPAPRSPAATAPKIDRTETSSRIKGMTGSFTGAFGSGDKELSAAQFSPSQGGDSPKPPIERVREMPAVPSSSGGKSPFPGGDNSSQIPLAAAANTGLSGEFTRRGLTMSGDRVLRSDGSAASEREISALKSALFSAPQAALKHPGMAPMLESGEFSEMKSAVESGEAGEASLDMGLSEDGRDIVWTRDCDRVSGDCNQYAAGSYGAGDFVEPDVLQAAWDQLEASAAEQGLAYVNQKLGVSLTRGPGGILERIKGMFSGRSKGNTTSKEAVQMASAGAFSGQGEAGSSRGFEATRSMHEAKGASAFTQRNIRRNRKNPVLPGSGQQPKKRDSLWLYFLSTAACFFIFFLWKRKKDEG